jgi:amino acid permease
MDSSSPKPLFTRLGEEIEEDQLDRDEDQGLPKSATWQSVGMLMIADVVGAGVMSLATAFAEVGWFIAIPSLVFWYMASMYIGVQIQTCSLAYPEVETFTQLAEVTFGHKAKVATAVLVYTFIFFVLGDYVLVLGETLEMIVNSNGTSSSHTCSHLVYSFFASILLLPLATIRLLGKTGVIMVVNMVSILLSLIVAFIGVLSSSRKFGGDTEFIAKSLTIYSFFHSQALFAFAYSGLFLLF